ncbi:MAG: type II secretion system protein [Snowella sp.]|jgi:type II secretory pathway pseudopilin PulG|nr:MAG: type II secretion system protein [Snowella sp.]
MLKTFFCLGFFSSKCRRFGSDLVYRNSGWTLLETIIVSLITGILGSIAIVNMLGIMNKNKVQNSLYGVKGALQEAQRNAIKMGKDCRILLKNSDNGHSTNAITIYDNTYAGCLSQEVVLEGLTMTENVTGNAIRFSYKGNTTNIGTILIQSPYTKTKYCLVVSAFLGIMRSGVYSETATGPISANNCQSTI